MNFEEFTKKTSFDQISIRSRFKFNKWKKHPHLVPKNWQEQIEEELLRSQERFNQVFKIEYPDLPVSQQKKLIQKELENNQIVILQAETGSGKTTQIPKIALEMGLSKKGKIGCTQPRRIAALTIADRLRDELKRDDLVSHKIRFIEQSDPNSQIKIMTDGILLQELQRDPLLLDYQCIILDEAHERSLNIDLLLGMFKRILKKRKDLKLIITSATLDSEQFLKFFPKAKLISCDGRSYPVNIEYHHDIDDDNDFHDLAVQAIENLWNKKPDNTLVFLPTEKDILELRDRLKNTFKDRANVLTLYGRLSAQDQKLVFLSSSKPKIILSTNVAETSLTIPDIGYVVDSGLARLARYNTRQRIQTLPIEFISKANARQRAGRAGRVKSGHCVRLYSEETYESLPDFADPEILRSNLSNVVLRLLSLKVNPLDFDFLKAPEKSDVRSALIHLADLGAIKKIDTPQLTSIGNEISKLPMDVNLARVLLEAKKNNILGPAIVINAAFCMQDLWAIPSEEPEKSVARKIQRDLVDNQSDLLTYLNLWNEWQSRIEQNYSHNKMRKWCKQNYISWMRMRDWNDLIKQFSRLLKSESALECHPIEKLNVDSLHQAFIPGFFHGIALLDKAKPTYRLSGNKEAFIFPASGLFKKKPQWLISCELRETSKLFLNSCFPIKPEWIPKILPQFCKKNYTHQHYNPQTGYVEASESITFRGLLVQKGRRIQYENIDYSASESIFWTDAIARGLITQKVSFLEYNIKQLSKLRLLEKKVRSNGLIPPPEKQAEWYLKNAHGVSNNKALRKFLKEHNDDKLKFDSDTWEGYGSAEDLSVWTDSPKNQWSDLYPDKIKNGPSLHYRYDHANDYDGIEIIHPSYQWKNRSAATYALSVPGYLRWNFLAWYETLNNEAKEVVDKNLDLIINKWKTELSSNKNSIWHSLYLACQEPFKKAEARFNIPKSFETYLSIHTPWGDINAEQGPATLLRKQRSKHHKVANLLLNNELNAFGVLHKQNEYWFSHPLIAIHKYSLFKIEHSEDKANPWFRDLYYRELKQLFDRIFNKIDLGIHLQESFLSHALNWLESNNYQPSDIFKSTKNTTKVKRSLKSLDDLKSFETSADSSRENALANAFIREFFDRKDLALKIWELLVLEWQGKPDSNWQTFWNNHNHIESFGPSYFCLAEFKEINEVSYHKLLKVYEDFEPVHFPKFKLLKQNCYDFIKELDLTLKEKKELDLALTNYDTLLNQKNKEDINPLRLCFFDLNYFLEELSLNNLKRGIQYIAQQEEEINVDKEKLLALRNAFKS